MRMVNGLSYEVICRVSFPLLVLIQKSRYGLNRKVNGFAQEYHIVKF